MEKSLWNLKFIAKQLERSAQKSEKEEANERAKLKKALMKGEVEFAKVYGENCIRQKNQTLTCRRMSARVDAVAGRVNSAIMTGKITGNISNVTKSMEAALNKMDLAKISMLMERFEKQFDNLDVQTSVMDSSISATSSTPVSEVDALMRQMADENGIDMESMLESSHMNEDINETELANRLAQLRK